MLKSSFCASCQLCLEFLQKLKEKKRETYRAPLTGEPREMTSEVGERERRTERGGQGRGKEGKEACGRERERKEEYAGSMHIQKCTEEKGEGSDYCPHFECPTLTFFPHRF